MIVRENLTINGRAFVKTYSDIGMKIERDGEIYDVAIDPAEFDRRYIETDEKVESEKESEEDEE